MSQQRIRGVSKCRLFQKTNLPPWDGSGGRPYAQAAAAPALRSPNFIFPLPRIERHMYLMESTSYVERPSGGKRKKGVSCVVVVRRLDAFPGIVPHRKSAEPRPDL